MIKYLVILMCLLLPSITFGSYQCGNKAIIHEGDSSNTVRSKCGAPYKEGQNSMVYNPGYGKFYEILTFEDD